MLWRIKQPINISLFNSIKESIKRVEVDGKILENNEAIEYIKNNHTKEK